MPIMNLLAELSLNLKIVLLNQKIPMELQMNMAKDNRKKDSPIRADRVGKEITGGEVHGLRPPYFFTP